MKFIVSWQLPSSTYNDAVARFLESGGMPPEGVTLVGRWHGMNGTGFAVAESDNPKALYEYQAQWQDLMPIQVTPCLEDEDAGAVLGALKG